MRATHTFHKLLLAILHGKRVAKTFYNTGNLQTGLTIDLSGNYNYVTTTLFSTWDHLKVIPQFCIAHFYCAHLITYNFIHYTYRLKKILFYDNFVLLQNIFRYIRAKNYVKINVLKKGIQKCS